MSTAVEQSAEKGALGAVEYMKFVNNAAGGIDDVNIFAKLIKKSEEAAQSAL